MTDTLNVASHQLGFVLAHAAACADADWPTGFVCPFAIVYDGDQYKAKAYEGEMKEAIALAYASLEEFEEKLGCWGIGYEGISGEIDVFMAVAWAPGLANPVAAIQRFAPRSRDSLSLIGEPESMVNRASPELQPDMEALRAGIAAHPHGDRWEEWSHHDA